MALIKDATEQTDSSTMKQKTNATSKTNYPFVNYLRNSKKKVQLSHKGILDFERPGPKMKGVVFLGGDCVIEPSWGMWPYCFLGGLAVS